MPLFAWDDVLFFLQCTPFSSTCTAPEREIVIFFQSDEADEMAD
jgi:hypothetical protein